MKKNAKTTIKLNGQTYNAVMLEGRGSIDGIIGAEPNPKPLTKSRPMHHVKKSPTPSKTLMRTAVKKPKKSQKKITQVSHPLNVGKDNLIIKSSTMVGSVDPSLLKRAESFSTSKKISRFGAAISEPYKSSSIVAIKQKTSNKTSDIKKTNNNSYLDKAVAKAQSHEQPGLSKKELKKLKPKRNKGHTAAYAIIGLMGLMVIAYAIYANIPNVMVKVASVRAGFSAVMPNYRPSGYSLTAVGYQPGIVTFKFSSNIDNRNFSLTEHSSNWDSATLVSALVVPTSGHKYKKITYRGQNVYLFGQDQASWVSNGIWYQVKGNNSLSVNQLLKLATTI